MMNCHLTVPIPMEAKKFVVTVMLPTHPMMTRSQKKKMNAEEKREVEWCYFTHIIDTLEEYFENGCFKIPKEIMNHKYCKKWIRAIIFYKVGQFLRCERKPLPNLSELALLSLERVNDIDAFRTYVEEKKQWDSTNTMIKSKKDQKDWINF